MRENQAVDSVRENFFCPIGTELIVQLEGSDAQLRSSLVGLDTGKFLIIKIPRTPYLDPEEMTDKYVKAIFLHNGTIFGFMSKILASTTSPAPLFFISCPETMQRHELRKNLRMECYMPVVIGNKEVKECNGVITDLSSGGCRVTLSSDDQSVADFKADGVFELSCEMLGIDREKPIQGIIKNLKQDDKRTHLGFQFDTSDTAIMERIQMYVNRILDVVQ